MTTGKGDIFPTPSNRGVRRLRKSRRHTYFTFLHVAGGPLKVITSIEEPEVVAKILAHIQRIAPDPQQAELPLGARAPPTQALLI
jgi:hypothetical protein